jgi:hypothetical protein
MPFGRPMKRSAEAGFDQIGQTPALGWRRRAVGLVLHEQADVVQRPEPAPASRIGTRIGPHVEAGRAIGREGLEFRPAIALVHHAVTLPPVKCTATTAAVMPMTTIATSTGRLIFEIYLPRRPISGLTAET